jgi:hypothetical protein
MYCINTWKLLGVKKTRGCPNKVSKSLGHPLVYLSDLREVLFANNVWVFLLYEITESGILSFVWKYTQIIDTDFLLHFSSLY